MIKSYCGDVTQGQTGRASSVLTAAAAANNRNNVM